MAEGDYVRKTISLDPEVYTIAVELARKRGFANSFSAYIAWLISRDNAGQVQREDVLRQPPATMLRVAEDAPGDKPRQ